MWLANWHESARLWVEGHVPGAEYLTLAALVVLVIAGLFMAAAVIRALRRLASGVRNGRIARRARKSRTPGFRILLSSPSGRAGRRAGRWLRAALSEHLGAFTFGAPIAVVPMGPVKGGLHPKSVARARRRMALADADLMIWGTRLNAGPRGFEIQGLSRGGGLTPAEARLFTLYMPGRTKQAGPAIARAAAYLIAKNLQPALSDPQAFRIEKISELAAILSDMLSPEAGLPDAVRGELEADFCASGLRVAEELDDLSVLDQVIAMRRAHISDDAAASDPGRIIRARTELGRALIVRASKNFDPAVVKEAIQHLAQAVEGYRGDPTIQQAQAASDSLFKAQTMIETRKRFSVNFGA